MPYKTTFSIFGDIFYPPNSVVLEGKRVFQHPRLFTTIDFRNGRIIRERQERGRRASKNQSDKINFKLSTTEERDEEQR
jgi:hypothetical protein